MGEPLKFDYYYGIEAEQFSFYRVPLLLIKDERFKGLSSDAIKNFLNLGTHARSLDGKERLRVLHEYFNQDTMEPFRFSFRELSESGKSVKDYIAPPGFDFRYPSRFKSGKMYGSVHYLDIIAPRFNDELLKKLLDIDDNLTITLHMQTMDPVKAIKMLKGALTNIQKMKIEEQKKAVRSGYDMDILPTDIITYEKDTLELLDDLNTNKSLFVVPNHLTEQWASDFLRLYPGANILAATKKDFEPANRKKFCSRIATGDYDAVIIGHSQFESTTCC